MSIHIIPLYDEIQLIPTEEDEIEQFYQISLEYRRLYTQRGNPVFLHRAEHYEERANALMSKYQPELGYLDFPGGTDAC